MHVPASDLHIRSSPASERTESRDSCLRTYVNVPPMSYQSRTCVSNLAAWTAPKSCQMLLRKEVIQPHLPVRLPCYDLVLITDPTFDGSLHKGWATGFGCYRLS